MILLEKEALEKKTTKQIKKMEKETYNDLKKFETRRASYKKDDSLDIYNRLFIKYRNYYCLIVEVLDSKLEKEITNI